MAMRQPFKYLADENTAFVSDETRNVQRVRKGVSDDLVLNQAKRNQRPLVTKDVGIADLYLRQRKHPGLAVLKDCATLTDEINRLEYLEAHTELPEEIKGKVWEIYGDRIVCLHSDRQHMWQPPHECRFE